MSLTECSVLLSGGLINTNSTSRGLLACAHRVCVCGRSHRHSQKKHPNIFRCSPMPTLFEPMLKIALCSVRTTCGHDIKQNTREKNYCRDDCVSSRHTDQAIRAAALGKGNTCRSVTMRLRPLLIRVCADTTITLMIVNSFGRRK